MVRGHRHPDAKREDDRSVVVPRVAVAGFQEFLARSDPALGVDQERCPDSLASRVPREHPEGTDAHRVRTRGRTVRRRGVSAAFRVSRRVAYRATGKRSRSRYSIVRETCAQHVPDAASIPLQERSDVTSFDLCLLTVLPYFTTL